MIEDTKQNQNTEIIQQHKPEIHHYIFHEIKINNEQDSDNVKALIRMYKDIQTKSDYKEIKNLIPTLAYTVLVERHANAQQLSTSPSSSNPKKTVRLYFSDIPIPNADHWGGEKKPGQVIDGIGYDIYQDNTKVKAGEESLAQPLNLFSEKDMLDIRQQLQTIAPQSQDPQDQHLRSLQQEVTVDDPSQTVHSYSLKKKSLKPGEGSFNFLKCFFIPYLTNYRVLFVTPKQQSQLQAQQKQRQSPPLTSGSQLSRQAQQQQYQSKQSKFKLTVPKGIKFLLNTQALDRDEKVQEKHLIPGFKKNCPEETILKNGETLSQHQKRKIGLLTDQVARMGDLCQLLIEQSTQPPGLPIGNSIDSLQFSPVNSLTRLSSVPNRSLKIQPDFSPQEYHKEALRLANELGRKDVIECDRIIKQSQLPQQLSGGSSSIPVSASQKPNLLQKVLPSTELVYVDDRTNIDDDDVVLSSPGGEGYYKLLAYKDADKDLFIYRFVEKFDSTKHSKVSNFFTTLSRGTPNRGDIVLVQIKDMNQTLENINQQQQRKVSDTPSRIIIYKNPIQDGFFVGLQIGSHIIVDRSSSSSSSSSSNMPIQINPGVKYFTLVPYRDVVENPNKFDLITFITPEPEPPL